MAWRLLVKTTRGHHIVPIVGAEGEAKAALQEAQAHLGATGVVQIMGRLTVKAEDITAVQIVERLLRESRRRI